MRRAPELHKPGRERLCRAAAEAISSFAMTDSGGIPAEYGPVLFDAKLTPHRSLPPQGFFVLMAAVCAVSFVARVVFFVVGAWPVVGFLGADVLLIYLAFRANYRHARMHESLSLTRGGLTVRRVNHWGEEQSWRFQPTWLQVVMDDPPRHESQLTLRSHGKSLTIGSFLTAEERLDLAKALRDALRAAQTAPGTA